MDSSGIGILIEDTSSFPASEERFCASCGQADPAHAPACRAGQNCGKSWNETFNQRRLPLRFAAALGLHFADAARRQNGGEMNNEMKLEFDAVSENEGFARVAVAAFITPLILHWRRWRT